MLDALVSACVPMMAGAQLILTIVLIKGEICPGQRGRIHRLLPIFVFFWLMIGVVHLAAFLLAGLIGYFYTQVKTGKTREAGPKPVIFLANAGAILMVIDETRMMPHWIAGCVVLLSSVLLGAMAAHLLLTIARTRLQAFHRLLPVVGILSAMLVTLCIVPFIYHMPDAFLNHVTESILLDFSLLVAAILMWSWHLFVVKAANKIQLSCALIILLSSLTGFNHLYYQTSICAPQADAACMVSND